MCVARTSCFRCFRLLELPRQRKHLSPRHMLTDEFYRIQIGTGNASISAAASKCTHFECITIVRPLERGRSRSRIIFPHQNYSILLRIKLQEKRFNCLYKLNKGIVSRKFAMFSWKAKIFYTFFS
jgi:hypothetical protein